MGRPYPNLIHPIPIELRLLNRENTVWDQKAREPIGRAVREIPVQLQAQVRWNEIGKPVAEFTGVRGESKGYLMFRYRDLEAAGVTIKRGDKITKIGNRVCSMFAAWFEDAGHYQDFTGACFLLVWFLDREPGEGD